MTIEERAKEYLCGDITHPARVAMYYAYVDGAKSQLQIDIDKACEWMKRELMPNDVYEEAWCSEKLACFRNDMTE